MALPDPPPVTAPPDPGTPDLLPPPQSSLTAPAGVPILDTEHQLPVHKGKVGRVTGHVKGAANSIADWFELRIALLKREVQDEIAAKKLKAEELGKAYGITAVLGIVALLAAFFMGGFAFVAFFSIWLSLSLALFIGWLVYCVIFAIATLIAYKRADKKAKRLAAADPDDARASDTPND